MVHVWLLMWEVTHCGLNQWCQKHEWLWFELNLLHAGWSLILWSLHTGNTSSTWITGSSCWRACRTLNLCWSSLVKSVHFRPKQEDRKFIIRAHGLWKLFMGQAHCFKEMKHTWPYLFDCHIECVLLMSSWELGGVNYTSGWLSFLGNCFAVLQPLWKHWN